MSEHIRVRRRLQLPLGGDQWVVLDGYWPISEQTWRHMLALLDALKPGLVWVPPRPVVPDDRDGRPTAPVDAPCGPGPRCGRCGTPLGAPGPTGHFLGTPLCAACCAGDHGAGWAQEE